MYVILSQFFKGCSASALLGANSLSTLSVSSDVCIQIFSTLVFTAVFFF